MIESAVGRPEASEYAPPFERYVCRVMETDVVGAMAGQMAEVREAFAPVQGAGERFRYAEGKWSPREMLGHLVDTERIMGYRAVCVARGETQSLPGFDENAYVLHADFDDVPLGELLDELAEVRASHLSFFRHLKPAAWRRVGAANAHPISVRALAHVIVGHPRHHLAVLRERYLPKLPA
jgi:hypothetical protein